MDNTVCFQILGRNLGNLVEKRLRFWLIWGNGAVSGWGWPRRISSPIPHGDPGELETELIMKKKFGTLIALATVTAYVGAPMAAQAQDITRLAEQCDYIWQIRDDRSALQRELDLILGGSDNSLTCRIPVSEEVRQSCEEQCVGLIVALLGGGPVAELPPGPFDPY
jgi:hypothetical protein